MKRIHYGFLAIANVDEVAKLVRETLIDRFVEKLNRANAVRQMGQAVVARRDAADAVGDLRVEIARTNRADLRQVLDWALSVFKLS